MGWDGKVASKEQTLHALETSMNQKLQVFGGHVHPLATHCWPKNAPALCSFLTPSWRLAWMCVSQRFVRMHPDASPNHACRHGQGREGIFNGSLVSFSPRSHHFLRDTEVQRPNAQLSPGVNASGCCVSRHWPLADSMRMFFFPFRLQRSPSDTPPRGASAPAGRFAFVATDLGLDWKPFVPWFRLWFLHLRTNPKTSLNVGCLKMCLPAVSVDSLGLSK